VLAARPWQRQIRSSACSSALTPYGAETPLLTFRDLACNSEPGMTEPGRVPDIIHSTIEGPWQWRFAGSDQAQPFPRPDFSRASRFSTPASVLGCSQPLYIRHLAEPRSSASACRPMRRFPRYTSHCSLIANERPSRWHSLDATSIPPAPCYSSRGGLLRFIRDLYASSDLLPRCRRFALRRRFAAAIRRFAPDKQICCTSS